MKVLVIKNSDSFLTGLDLVLKHFITGMEQAGAECDVVNLNMMEIKACRICTEDLTFDDRGRCNCDDDMQLLYPKLKETNNWVIATPFTGKIPGKLINFLDRLGPLFTSDPNHTEVEMNGNLALISSSANYESEIFKNLCEHFEDYSTIVSKKFLGCIERPHSSAIDYANTNAELLNEVLNAAEKLGKEYVENSEFSSDNLNSVKRALITKVEYEKMNEKLYQS